MNLPDESSPDKRQDEALVADRYRLIRRIAAGGMGEVFEAEQISTQRPVALKLMLRASNRPLNRHRFAREAEHLGRLHHQNIAEIFDAGEHNQQLTSIPFIAMELIADGKPITQWAAEQNLSISDRLSLAGTACDALAHAHASNVVHRDLKPSNVLVDARGTLKLIDFGLSQTLRPFEGDASSGETLYSDASLLFGTPEYMSPERFNQRVWRADGSEGQRAGTVADDIYGIGVILFQLVCGRVPFELSDRAPSAVTAFASMVGESSPPEPRQLNPSISVDVETIVFKCLAKEPSDRYRTASDLAGEIRRAIANEPIEAKRPGQMRRSSRAIRRGMRRHPLASLITASICALLLSRFGANCLDFVVGLRFERFVMSRPALQYFDANRELSHVRLISIPPGINPAKLAAEIVPPALVGDPKVLRAVDGALMKRLSDEGCTPLSFAWDIIFEGDADPAIDQVFANGAAALMSRKIGVVVATARWDTRDYSKRVADASILASVTASIEPTAPWSMMTARLAGGQPLQPSLSLAASACAQLRSAGPLQGNTLNGVMVFQSSSGARADFPYSFVRKEDADADYGVNAGDYIAQSYVELPSAQSLAQATVSYTDVLQADRDQLHRWFDGRTVLVADLRPGKDIVGTYLDGRSVAGGYVNLTAIEQNLEGRAIRYLPMLRIGTSFVNAAYLIEGVVFAVSLLLGLRLAFAHGRRVLIESLALSLCFGMSLLLYRDAGVIYSPLTLLVTIPLAAEIIAATVRLLPRSGPTN